MAHGVLLPRPMKLESLALLLVVFLGGCAATPLRPGAGRVMVTKSPAPTGCVFVGSIIGEQGGAMSGAYTSNADLAQGALNDMKNKAHALGANYVVLENTQAGNTLSGSRYGVSSAQTDVTHMGNAFRCPPPAAADSVVSAPSATGRPGAANDVVIVGM